MKEMTKYNYSKVSPKSTFNYISSRANEMKVKLLNIRKEHPINSYDLEYPNIAGIYVNKKLSEEEDF
jgi:PIN domain nuclease of toxin-antitoxin system